MEKVWEARVFSTGATLFLIISLVIVIYCVYILKNTLSNSNSKVAKIVCIFVIATLVIINLLNINDRYTELKHAKMNAVVVEGKVENFVYSANGSDSFSVNDVYFKYPTIDTSIGYDIPKRDKGAIITHEGQFVKITYFNNNGNNIIIKIETTLDGSIY